MRSRVAPLILAAIAAVSALVAVWPELQASPTARAGAVPATPVLSLRRVPALVSRAVGDAKLRKALDSLTRDPALGGATDQSCLSVRDTHGRTLYTKNSGSPLIPASNLKLLTATAALDRLGAEFRYTTELKAPAAPGPDGAIGGDLWLVGSGDPLLGTADFAAVAGYQRRPRLTTSLEALADKAVAAGLRRVDGRIVGDETRYDAQRYVPTWSPTYIRDSEVGPLSALTVNGGFVRWDPPVLAAPDPPANAASVLTGLLRARGVTIAGDGASGRAAEGSVTVAALSSPPVIDILGVMLRESDNTAAELIVKELGTRFGGSGTTAAGVEVIRGAIGSLGAPTTGFAAVDGSGLDRSDRVSCDLLQATLAKSGDQGPIGRDLPTAGRDGTLAKRFVGTPAAGRVRAKTGSLRGVIGLSGWVTADGGRLVQFSLLANELPR
ncbi:MAG: D-alanyl-D-alanine carboxypeptidase/D-alanyl-D-alanine-endopeptidase, partial [Actinomycetota bacterium]|nr:D-alanyl-D-alanine carboxypeptidase/D-alanyl-D-alanine-endopeptidase [Actinomycetota bacterium]